MNTSNVYVCVCVCQFKNKPFCQPEDTPYYFSDKVSLLCLNTHVNKECKLTAQTQLYL